MSYAYKSSVSGDPESDIIYYNASIINNNTRATGTGNGGDPAIRFQETRDTALITDASKYNFSIVRFQMMGPNKDLPLFIPQIQTNRPGAPQTNPDLTVYSLAIAYQREWITTNQPGGIMFTIAPGSTPILYRSETQNPSLALTPIVPPGGIAFQDLSTRYYWVYTYRHWCDLVNEAMLTAMETLRTAFSLQWAAAATGDAFPYPTLVSFLADHDVPFIKYDENTEKFSIYGDTRAFNVTDIIDGSQDVLGRYTGVGTPVPAFVAPVGPNPQPATEPFLRLFFNANLFGLFTNFKNAYYNVPQIRFPLTPTVLTTVPTGVVLAPTEYTNEILFTNENYTNILNNNPLLQGSTTVPPPPYNPLFLIPSIKQNLYWTITQDYSSTDSLWSPIESIVFISTLLPVKNEFVGEPTRFGEGNLGFSSATVPSAFLPIVTDLTIDTGEYKAHGYRETMTYTPTAEYRMATMGASKQEIRNLDISVYWKNRLDGSINPVQMFNLSSVSIKIMFRKIGGGSL
jgi:hypothetical protein